MKINKKDYAKLKYNFHALKAGESIFDMGDLAPLKDVFSTQGKEEKAFDLDPEFVLKYLILMYSPGSPAIEKFQQMGKRKTWVLSQLGVEPDAKNHYPDNINYLVTYKCAPVVRKTSVFLSLQKPIDWQIRLHGEEQLDRLLTMKERDEDEEGNISPSTLSLADELKLRQLIEETRIQIEGATLRMMEAEPSLLQELDVERFAAQTYLGIRIEEQIKFLPPMPKPKDQKADTFFSHVKKLGHDKTNSG